jgi:hypothetical protein
MDDQREDCRPSAVSGAADAAHSNGERGTPATGPPSADLPASLGERMELRIRIAELTAVIDTIVTALRDARAAGLKVTERHERLVAGAKAAAGLLRMIARRLE